MCEYKKVYYAESVWFGFILVIPSEVQENVTEAPEKPGKYEHTITSL